jgi:TetR/AcrR family transcriptional regulator, transcriptional repressor for nem operon
MPYPAGHRATIKKNIIESARKLFNRHGFENVSIAQIMAGAGLTHGGFYSYFKGKSDLYAEVLGCFFTDPNWKNCWKGVQVDLTSTDVARSNPRARQAFEEVFKGMVSVLERSLIQNGQPRRTTAQALAALCVGGMVVARAIADRRLADNLCDACLTVALQLGGWPANKRPPNGEAKKSLRSGAAAS